MLRAIRRSFASPALRLRVGIVLWAVSWMPIAQVVGASASLRIAIWSAQVVIGIVGIALAGSTFVTAVKQLGWRRAPRALLRGLIHGDAAAPA